MKRKKVSLDFKNVFLFILIGIFLISSISFVSSAKQVPEFPDGFTLRLPQVETFKQYDSADSYVHVFNTSNGMPIISGTSCYWHLYNETGSHIAIGFDSTVDAQGFDYEFEIDGANFSKLGQYSFIIQCNNSIGGGFVAGSFEVTSTGRKLSSSQSILYIGLLAIFVLILFASFFGMNLLPKSNTQDKEGKILSVNYLKYLRLPLWLFAYFLFIAIIFLSSNIALAFLQEQMFGKMLFAIFNILFALAPVVIILIVISFFIRFYHDKEFQKLINRGMFPQGKF